MTRDKAARLGQQAGAGVDRWRNRSSLDFKGATGGMGDGRSVVHQRVTRHHHLAVKGTDQHVRLRWSEREARGYETD